MGAEEAESRGEREESLSLFFWVFQAQADCSEMAEIRWVHVLR